MNNEFIVMLPIVAIGLGVLFGFISLIASLFKKRSFGVICLAICISCFALFFVSLKVLEETKSSSLDNTTASTAVTEDIIQEIPFDDIYMDYKKNELVADDLYKGNRYRVTATINGIETGGLFNLNGGATLTMQTQVGNTIVFFYAEFEKEQEEALKKVVVGDTITFEGTCLSAGIWIDCEIVG